jgi:hypothetical protein
MANSRRIGVLGSVIVTGTDMKAPLMVEVDKTRGKEIETMTETWIVGVLADMGGDTDPDR